MSPALKDQQINRLAREIPALTGETLTGAIHSALEERLRRERLRRGTSGGLAARLREIGEHCASLPDFETGTAEEIVGYDANGMWTSHLEGPEEST